MLSPEIERLGNMEPISDRSDLQSAPPLDSVSPGEIIIESDPSLVETAKSLDAGVPTALNCIRNADIVHNEPDILTHMSQTPPISAYLAVKNVQVSGEQLGYADNLAGLEHALISTMEKIVHTTGARAYALDVLHPSTLLYFLRMLYIMIMSEILQFRHFGPLSRTLYNPYYAVMISLQQCLH